MLWLALHFPYLGLEVWEEARSASGRAVVLLEGNRVALGNERAQSAGIRPGTSLATAHSIDPSLVPLQRDTTRERKRLELLGEIVYRFSSQVAVAGPDGLVLEIGGSLALFGDPAALAGEAQRVCRALGHQVRWQLAPTPGAALVLAASGKRRLADVPLNSARLPEAGKHLESLANMGFRTLGDLLRLPETALARRCGPDLVAHLGRLTGGLPDPQRFLKPAAGFDQTLALLEPVRNKDALLDGGQEAPMERLLGALEQWLISRQLGAEQLIWFFSAHAESERVAVPLTLARPRQSREAFRNVVRTKLEQVALPEDVLCVRLRAARLVPWSGSSPALFRLPADAEGRMPEAEVFALIDELRARLGDGGCSRIVGRDRHLPEAAWVGVDAGTSVGLEHGHPAPPIGSGTRPVWLFDPPRPVERALLSLLKGPERIQTGWWHQGVWRDYYVACLSSGARCWAFVDASGHWYLHGYFG